MSLAVWQGHLLPSMSMLATLTIQLNGQQHTFTDLPSPTNMSNVISALDLKADRIAVEKNGEIVPRDTWSTSTVSDNDRIEIVHFVGGGRL